jgi:hypothetical protein
MFVKIPFHIAYDALFVAAFVIESTIFSFNITTDELATFKLHRLFDHSIYVTFKPTYFFVNHVISHIVEI